MARTRIIASDSTWLKVTVPPSVTPEDYDRYNLAVVLVRVADAALLDRLPPSTTISTAVRQKIAQAVVDAVTGDTEGET